MSKPFRILLTGSSGQVGFELARLLTGVAEVYAPLRKELDLSEEASIRGAVQRFQPDWIINPAAYTAVDKAEIEPERAYAINAEAPRILAEEAARSGARILHYSTDYVFPGNGTRPWSETDATGPLNVYGQSKLAGEKAIRNSGAQHVIVRTSWVYGAHGHNFVRTILRYAEERPELAIVSDQIGAPTWSHDLARLALHLIQTVHDGNGDALQGVYHACNAGETSWYGFACEFLRLAKVVDPEKKYAVLRPIPTSEYKTPAARPLNSRLDCTRLARELGFSMPTWQESLAKVMADIHQTESTRRMQENLVTS